MPPADEAMATMANGSAGFNPARVAVAHLSATIDGRAGTPQA